MSDILKDFVRETIDELLNSLPVEERIKGLSAEDLRKSLSVEERLKGLSVEELVRALPAEILAEIARKLETKSPPFSG